MIISPGRLIAAGVAVALLSGIAGGVLGVLLAADEADKANSTVAATSPGGATCDLTRVSTVVFPSLVTINVRLGSAGGLGSGSVWDSEGHILTNDHVLAPAVGGAITVDFACWPARVPATVVGRDPATDLAVIRVEPGLAPLHAIGVDDSSAVVVGQPVVAAGSPLGLNGTITAGVVSALNRYIDVGQGDQPAALLSAARCGAAGRRPGDRALTAGR